MRTVHTERHRLRDARTERHGGEPVRPFECPERRIPPRDTDGRVGDALAEVAVKRSG